MSVEKVEDYNLLHKISEAALLMGPRVFSERYHGYYLMGIVPDSDEDDFETGVISTGKMAEMKKRVRSMDPSPVTSSSLKIESRSIDPGPFLVQLKKHRANCWFDWISVGRAGNNDIALSHPSVSKLHARIHLEHDKDDDVIIRHLITDTESTIGTFLNEKRIEGSIPTLMTLGDTLKFGVVECQFLSASGIYRKLRSQ